MPGQRMQMIDFYRLDFCWSAFVQMMIS